ncbi:MAG: dynamin family protein [Pseudomonadota bacterium]
MTSETPKEQNETEPKMRIALMGEFSAGKSTLANVLMGEQMSPTQITATQLPPIWYAHGEDRASFVLQDGTEDPIEDGIDDVEVPEDVRAIRVHARCDILESCDIIDMPGSSDPNMNAEAWQNMLPLADAVLWCTPAPQAWRQSEAAIWEGAEPGLWSKSLLLLTRIDKISDPRDREKIVRRVRGEAGEYFRDILPVSLLDAGNASHDSQAWQASGMGRVIDRLLEIFSGSDPAPFEERSIAADAPRNAGSDDDAPAAPKVMPRRVVRTSDARRGRPKARRATNCDSVI